jgi:hypothetical protein
MPHRILTVILLVGISLGIGNLAQAQGENLTEPTKVDYTIGGQINFETRVITEDPIQEVWVFVRPRGDANTIAGLATLHPSNGVTYILELAEHPIPAYATIEFWYQIKFEDGMTSTTAPEGFIYADNRFEWQTLAAPPFEAAWYEGDLSFGQEALNAAQEGLEKLEGLVSVPAPNDISIFVYASAAELQTALRLSGQTGAWVAGHASPEQNTAVVTIPPGPAQSYEIQRQIPHEVAHITLYQWLGADYYNLPQWLREGLSSMTELFPNPDYALLLNNAYETETLQPMASLCESFPMEASGFLLAYAQATDFSWFLFENYGRSGLDALVAAYADGLSCDQGTQEAFGKSLNELERDWRRQTFGENTLLAAIDDLLPWLVLMGIVLLAPILMMIGGRRKKVENEK